MREVKTGIEARILLKNGVDILANAVKVTLGPRGRNVVIDRGGKPHITKDGVSVAKEVKLDGIEGLGASIIKEAASKTNDIAGDGTTTSTVLAQSMINSGFRYLELGANPVGIKRGMDKAVLKLTEKLKEISTEVIDLEKVASISANDEFLGKVISGTIKQVGKDGSITVEDSQILGVYSEIVDGMRIDKGMLTPRFANTPKGTAEYENQHILITDKKIETFDQLIPILEELKAKKISSLTIVCDDIEDAALTPLIVYKLQGVMNTLVIRAPSFGEYKREILRDLAAFTGATMISSEMGVELEGANLFHLGLVKKIIATKTDTTFIEGNGYVEDRVELLQNELEIAESVLEKDKLKARIANLNGGVGVIKVGTPSESETGEIKDRIEDAIHACKAALEEGIVPGGGLALLQIQDIDIKSSDFSESCGVKIVQEALEAPLRQIVINAGESDDVVLEKIKEQGFKFGYDASKDGIELVDMISAGIIDPTKITRSALQNAVSVASLLLTTECVIK